MLIILRIGNQSLLIATPARNSLTSCADTSRAVGHPAHISPVSSLRSSGRVLTGSVSSLWDSVRVAHISQPDATHSRPYSGDERPRRKSVLVTPRTASVLFGVPACLTGSAGVLYDAPYSSHQRPYSSRQLLARILLALSVTRLTSRRACYSALFIHRASTAPIQIPL